MATKKDKDFATEKSIDISKPEEEVRQEYEKTLHYDFQYPKECMDIEVVIRWGSNNKGFADLVIYKSTDQAKRNQNSDILGIIETKNKNRSDGLNQLMSYMAASSCLWGIWTNGKEIEFLYKNPESGEINRNVIFGVPHHGREIDSIGTHTFGDLIPARNLKLTFRRLLNELYTNTNISRREKLGNEMVKLLFCKLQDEQTLIDVPHTIPEFRVGLKDHEIGFVDVKHRIDNLFGKVKSDLVEEGVFDLHETILLENKSIAYVVGELQEYSLAKTDEDAVGSAFEVFAESKFVGEKGEFFTPREVVKTAIQIINPRPGDMIMDPACGSGGFLICALQHIWDIMQNESPWKDLPGRKLDESKLRIAESTVHGIDKEIDLVKITKAYMAIIGDGKSQIAQANSLHPLEEFDGHAKDLIFDNGQPKQFDAILTNPPFGSKDTKVSKVESATYDLGHKWKKTQNGDYKKTDQARPTPAQELFIERCLQLLKDGGRLAIILPETYAHAPTKKYIVEYFKHRCNIKAVIDLPHNSFRPHCNAKTLLWIIEKGTPQRDVIFAVAEEIGRDHLGKTKYRIRNGRLTDEVWDDSEIIREELKNPYSADNKCTLVVPVSDIKDNIFVPRYYWYWNKYKDNLIQEAEAEGLSLIPIRKLIDEGIITYFRGHGSPPNEYKGWGTIPYVRAGDIGNWALYKNPTSMIPEHVYLSVKGNRGVELQGGDVIFVKEGSYRIGDVAIVLPTDTNILLNDHCIVLRVVEKDNPYGIDHLYLTYLLSHRLTKKQIPFKVFYDTTLPNIGNRWLDLELPISFSENYKNKIKQDMASIFDSRTKCETLIHELTK